MFSEFSAHLVRILAISALALTWLTGCHKVEKEETNTEVMVSSSGAEYLAHEVIVKKAQDTSESEFESALSNLRARVINRQSRMSTQLGFLRVELPDHVNADEAISKLLDLGVVEEAERNYVIHLNNTPNDPRLVELWGMEKIKAMDAWDTTTGSKDVLVAVIDTGVDLTHPELAANIWTNPQEIAGNGIDDDGNGYVDDVYGWDWYNDDNDPTDDHGHGSHCSGTIGAVGNNGDAIVGVNWNVSIMALKFLSAGGSGNNSDAVESILYAAEMDARIVSASWGCSGCYTSYMEDAIQTLADKGGLFVAAAGNSATDNDVQPHYPSSYTVDNVVAVASTTASDAMSSFSCYGINSVHLGAPGSDILSTYMNGGYKTWSGTSMATPHVAGVAALYLSHYEGASYDNIKLKLMGSTDKISALAGKVVSGGRLNAYKMLTSDETPPAAPEGVVAEMGYRSDVNVSWSPNTETDMASYRVSWGTMSEQYIGYVNVPEDEVSVRITDLENDVQYYFAVIAIDKMGNFSEPSAEVTATPADNLAPGQVMDLSGAPPVGLPASGIVGAASSEASEYYKAANAHDGNPDTAWISMPGTEADEEYLVVHFDQPSKIDRIVLTPSAVYPEFFPVDFDIETSRDGSDWTIVGGRRNASVTADETMEFHFRCLEASSMRIRVLTSYQHTSGNRYAGLAEMTAYQRINNPDTVVLEFTAPGDDPGEGKSAHYDIRYSTSPIDENSFADAEPAWNPPPRPAGILQIAYLYDLEPETTYFFAMTATDEAGNTSPLSNIAVITTLVMPPSAISDLAVIGSAAGSVELGWTAPGDNGSYGQAESYELRYSDSLITPANFEEGTVVPGLPSPGSQGTYEIFNVTGLTVGRHYYFAVRATDINGFTGASSNSVSAIAEGSTDTTPPATIQDLDVVPSVSSIKLNPTLVDSSSYYVPEYAADKMVDGNVNTGWISNSGKSAIPEWAIFDLGELVAVNRFRTRPLVYGSWLGEYPRGVDFQVSVDGANWTTVVHVEGHEGGLATWDEWGCPITYARYVRLYVTQRGASSCYDWGCNGTGWVAVSEFEIYAATPEFDVDLSWIAPGDDDWTGTAAAYDLRRSLTPITPGNFYEAVPVPIDPPGPAGALEFVTVGALERETQHYFAVKTRDESSNTSAISNVVSIGASSDPPAPVTDLQAIGADKTSIELQWTATGDDGLDGTATAYDLRYSETPITIGNWDLAFPVSDVPAPQPSGSTETFVVNSLDSNTFYYFAIKVIDDWDGTSLLSNAAFAETLDGINPATVQNLTATPVDDGSTIPIEATVSDSSGSFSSTTQPYNLFDGEKSTMWMSPGRATQQTEYLVIDLPKQTRLGRIRLVTAKNYEDLFPVDFHIEVRANEIDPWTEVVNEKWFFTDNDFEEWMLGAVIANQIRLTVTRTSAWNEVYYAALSEMEIYDEQGSFDTIRLSWTAPGDDGDVGTAAEYDLRMANTSIGNDADFASAAVVGPLSSPQHAGLLERLDVHELSQETTYCFAMKSKDESDNISGLSNSPCATTPGIPPATVTDLQVTDVSPSSATLAWTAPGDDGDVGQAAEYHIRVSTERINTTNWDLATEVPGVQAPAAAGFEETFTVNDLDGATRYFFALRTLDTSGNWSPISGNAIAETDDDIPPDPIADLQVFTDTSAWGSLTFTWTAPGDEGPSGKVDAYELRISQSPIAEHNFDNAFLVSSPEPQPGGFEESASVTGLAPEILYYAAVRSIDESGNKSAISNVASAETRDESPGAVTDLETIDSTGDETNNGTVTLRWTAPGDDANLGTATSYDIRYSKANITSGNFAQATPVANEPDPDSSEESQEHVVSGLTLGTNYYFALKTEDERGNISEISNVVMTKTPDTIPPSQVTDLVATTGSSRGSISITWISPGDDDDLGRVAKYDLRYSDQPITEASFGSAIPVTTQPSGGQLAGMLMQVLTYGFPEESLVYLALRAADDEDNWSPMSNAVSARTKDVPPGQVNDLSLVEASLTSLTLSWTAPGDDDYTGTPSAYDLRISTQMITDSNFDAATRVPTGTPGVVGTSETAMATGLEPNTVYYLMIRAGDERDNWSYLSSVVHAATTDDEPPGQITDLVAGETSRSGMINLAWTAPGDDGYTGLAKSYEARRSLDPITPANWLDATLIEGLPTPRSSGLVESYNVSYLQGEIVHHFAIRAIDDNGNAGPISPDTYAETLAIPPARVLDLTAEASSSGSVELTWTAPGDDSNEGTATRYDIRFSTTQIVWHNFNIAQEVANEPDPETAGTAQSMTITGLDESTTYWFALKAIDEKDATSYLSNVPSATTIDETSPAAVGSLSVSSPSTGGEKLEPLATEASSCLGDSLGSDNVIDDNELTSWVSTGDVESIEESLTIDYGEARSIDKVRILSDESYAHLFPRNFIVALSEDKQSWTEVVSVEEFEASPSEWMTFGFAPHTAQYVRVSSYDPATSYFGLHYAVIAEIEAYETKQADGQAQLTWVAPGDDDHAGTANHYELFKHTSSFDEATLHLAEQVFGLPVPAVAGSLQAVTQTGLAGEQRYYWAMRAVDESDNIGPLSEVVTGVTQEVAPAPISDLSSDTPGMNEATLTWTSPGDDGDVGTATSYEMRYAPWSLTAESFPLADEVTDLPSPSPAGNEQSVTVTGLEAGTLYRFAIIARDEAGAASHLSNVALVATEPEPDTTAPGTVIDLSAEVPVSGGQPIPGVAVEWSSEQLPDFTAASVIDEELTTMWSSTAKSENQEEWVIIDLQTATPAESLRIWPSDSYADLFPPGIEVRTSPDALVWSTLFSRTDYVATPGQPLEGSFPVTPIRYVELIATDLALNDNGYFYSVVAELEMITADTDPGTIVVNWTATGDDAQEGQADEYDLRIGACPYDHSSAVSIATDNPLEVGEPESIRVNDLVPGTYCLGLIVLDEAGNPGAPSNVTEVVID